MNRTIHTIISFLIAILCIMSIGCSSGHFKRLSQIIVSGESHNVVPDEITFNVHAQLTENTAFALKQFTIHQDDNQRRALLNWDNKTIQVLLYLDNSPLTEDRINDEDIATNTHESSDIDVGTSVFNTGITSVDFDPVSHTHYGIIAYVRDNQNVVLLKDAVFGELNIDSINTIDINMVLKDALSSTAISMSNTTYPVTTNGTINYKNASMGIGLLKAELVHDGSDIAIDLIYYDPTNYTDVSTDNDCKLSRLTHVATYDTSATDVVVPINTLDEEQSVEAIDYYGDKESVCKTQIIVQSSNREETLSSVIVTFTDQPDPNANNRTEETSFIITVTM